MTAAAFFEGWWTWFSDWLLADDETHAIRIGVVVIVGIMIWRAIWLLATQAPPSAPVRQAPTAETATNIPAVKRWFPTRQQRLQQAIDNVRAETDLIISQTEETKASAGLRKARAELAELIDELQPAAPAPRATEPSAPALTLREIEQCLDLLNLTTETRAQLLALLGARIEEKANRG